MEVFLLRHGCAEPSAARDRDRRLTAEGREELHRVLRDVSGELAVVNRVLVSPYVRAQQTSDIAMEYLPHLSSNHRQTLDFLTPGSNPQRLLDWLAGQPDDLCALFVTHQPLVGTLLDELCGFETGRYRMGTGALAHLHLPLVGRGLADLIFLKQP
ncbi:phosphohistidine phosphatase SixA [Saccharophagus sp. K07]|uniref:phosphohistidine phosphatase SixA n=1 Tax=Saccharophagus sp. K07 TaxID=2283636 RepID=UPI001652A839|nr:phosphohistidine phosphatase SixA [Saccharophagus sp. K07]MBC6904749.1 phosphohistidine phosphatase SixA [Saccharophagus sp. K07]